MMKQERQTENRSKLMRYWFIIQELTGREIKRKYARSFLGILWSVLQPLLHMTVMAMVFTHIFSNDIEKYPLYLLSGQIVYSLFSGITNASMTALVDNKNMLIKVKFPKLIFPLSRGMTALVNFGYSMLALLVVMLFFRSRPSIYMLLVPFDIGFLFLFGTGIGYMLSVLYVFFADIRHLYSVFLTLLMYCSAIFYSVERLGPAMQHAVELNPVYNYISIFRKTMIYAQRPELRELAGMVLWGALTYFIGLLIFKRSQNAVMQSL